jgi:hypothetical protein
MLSYPSCAKKLRFCVARSPGRTCGPRNRPCRSDVAPLSQLLPAACGSLGPAVPVVGYRGLRRCDVDPGEESAMLHFQGSLFSRVLVEKVAMEHPAVIAVVDAVEDRVVVWWVGTEVSSANDQTGRLCGAWVLGPGRVGDLDSVLRGRRHLPTVAGAEAVSRLGLSLDRLVDMAATHRAVAATGERLQNAYDAELSSKKGRKLAPLGLPALPGLIDVEDVLTTNSTGGDGARALVISRSIERLCGVWSEMESTRLSRPYLRHLGEPSPGPLPVVAIVR